MTSDNDFAVPTQAPAASLLFQAPTFQAPVFEAPAVRPSRHTDEEGSAHGQSARSGRGRTRKQDANSDREVSTPQVQENADETHEENGKAKRRRSKTNNLEENSSSSKKTRKKQRENDETPREAEGGEISEHELTTEQGDSSTDGDSEDLGTTRRRRRRRVRSASVDVSEEETDGDDEVKALKGSTRLEAKKQRRREGRKEGRRRHGITESEFLARRESVNRKMVIRDYEGLDQIAILEDDLLVEHYVARRTQKSMVGNIYLGRVQNVLPSMEAAFVDIGRGRNAVLYAGEVNWDAVGLEGKPRRIESALKSGDPVLVQVTKDPIGHKGARLTSQITLAGRYLVLIPNGSMMGISRKLPDKERHRLKKILRQVVPQGSGVIVRTAAEGASEEQIRDDVARLTKQWADIESKRTQTKNAPVLLRGEPELAMRVVRDIFNEDFAELLIQGREVYSTIKEYVEELSPELAARVQQWVGTDDIFHAHRVDEQLSKGMDRKVWLPSGGTLIIDRTEAMTVIDVNTGKYIGAGGTLEETVTRNNLEAAEEIVRQLRLRDIGGIVIIDFVDMVLEQNRDLVLRRLVECLSRDRTRHQVTEITSLGLVQMTRKRVGEGLVEAFSTPCETCDGRGFIVHDHPVELTGAHDHTGTQPKASKKSSKKVAEPRRIDEQEQERAKEALSAIAAATRKNGVDDADGQSAAQPAEATDSAEASATLEKSTSSPKKTAKKRRAQEQRTHEEMTQSESMGADAEEEKASTPQIPVKKTRTKRVRRVASMPQEQTDTVGVSAGNEPSEADAIPAASPTEEASAQVHIEGQPHSHSEKPVSRTPQATKRPRRRRATAESMEVERTSEPLRLELPAKRTQVDGETGASPRLSTDEIELPEGHRSTPKARGRSRRRVASSGVSETPAN